MNVVFDTLKPLELGTIRSFIDNLRASPENVFQCFDPVLTVATIGGVNALKTTPRTDPKPKLVYSLARFLIGFGLFWVSFIHMVFIPKMIVYVEEHIEVDPADMIALNETKPAEIDISSEHFKIKMVTHFTSSLALAFRIIGLFCQGRKLSSHILEKLHKIDEELLHQPLARFAKDAWVLKGMILILLGISCPLQIYLAFFVSNQTWVSIYLISMTYFNNFSIMCCEIQFCAVCYLITSRFQFINSSLHDMDANFLEFFHLGDIPVDGQDLPLQQQLFKQSYMQPKSNYPSTEQSRKQLPIETKATQKLSSYDAFFYDRGVADRFLDLRRAHVKLTKLCETTNDLYNLQLLLSCVSNVFKTIMNYYFAMFGIFKNRASRSQVALNQVSDEFISMSISATLYFMRFFCVNFMATLTAHEANGTKVFILNLLHKFLPSASKRESWIFLTACMVKDVKFAACGLFELNVTHVFDAISAAFTYFLIMLQFHNK